MVYYPTPMSQRHPIQGGKLMFITTNLKDSLDLFSDPAAARIAVETLYSKQVLRPFYIYGFVIMPTHCHFLFRVPEKGSISKIMNVYKRGVCFALGKGSIWQPRFHMSIPNNFKKVLHYIHWNPVEAGLCERPEEYLWSSASGEWDITELDWMGIVV